MNFIPSRSITFPNLMSNLEVWARDLVNMLNDELTKLINRPHITTYIFARSNVSFDSNHPVEDTFYIPMGLGRLYRVLLAENTAVGNRTISVYINDGAGFPVEPNVTIPPNDLEATITDSFASNGWKQIRLVDETSTVETQLSYQIVVELLRSPNV